MQVGTSTGVGNKVGLILRTARVPLAEAGEEPKLSRNCILINRLYDSDFMVTFQIV